MKQFLLALLCVVAGLLADFVLSHVVVNLFLPSAETLSFAKDYILLG